LVGGVWTASTTFACVRFSLMFGDVGTASASASASASWVVHIASVDGVCQVQQCKHCGCSSEFAALGIELKYV